VFSDFTFGQRPLSEPDLQLMYDQHCTVKTRDKIKQSERARETCKELKELRKEIALLRDLIEKLLAKPPAVKTNHAITRKVWKQVRPSIQIEGMIDDGFELVDEPKD